MINRKYRLNIVSLCLLEMYTGTKELFNISDHGIIDLILGVIMFVNVW